MQKSSSFSFLPALSLILLAFIASGCSSLKFPGVYRIAVMQGNIIDQKKVDQLKLGMTKRQVQYVMGTPLLTDVFHEDRWDYIYQLRRGDKQLRDKRFTLYFESDALVRYDGDYEPKGPEETEDQTEQETETYIEDAKQTQG